ncbi:MAG: hypothetical protein QM692_04535 [Thermomicrobiales bacterium]
MDAQRFDNMAKSLAGRWSRRKALRQMGAAAGAGLLAAAGVREEQARALVQAQSDGKPLYTMIRRYTLDEPTARVRKALQAGYTDAACKAPGFVAYLTVEDEDGDFATVAVFESQDALEDFAKAEASWIAQNLGNLLPAPAEAISGDTYIHAVAQKGFTNTCPARSPQGAATVTPADNGSNNGALPTAVPGAPTPTPTPLPSPTPEPNCRDAGCVCTTGTNRACKGELVCCPTTDLEGGPGICRTQAECYPNQCPANGAACPDTCSSGSACPACCSGYCAADGTCGDAPAPCTGAGCDCNGGVQRACDDGLVCCQSGQSIPGGAGTCQTQADCDAQPCTGAGCSCATGTEAPCDSGLVCCATTTRPGGPGVCQTESQCAPVACTGEGCECNGGVQGNCDAGLVCCANGESIPGGVGTCTVEAQCAPAPCTGAGCDCNGGVQGACDDGLVCCQSGESIPGGAGTCTTEAECNPPCTGEGCACNGGVQGACDTGLICCQDESIPGGPGTCTTEANCAPPACTGAGCSCNGGVQGNCDTGLVCCQSGQSIPGGPGVCVVEGSCVSQTCVATGTGCDATCNWGDACDSCCTGYCNSTGVCGDEPPAPVCVADGELCTDDCAWSDACNSCCSGFCNGSGVCSEPGASAGACGDEGCQCAVNNPCNEGLICCDDGSGERGVCQTAC